MPISDIKPLLQNAGIVGAGGAGFPAYAKLAEGADLICVNCAECEPLLYTDYMLLQEEITKIVEGIKVILSETGIKQALLVIKAHRAAMLSYSDGQALAENVTVKIIPNVYPIGDEIGLIYEATGRRVAPGALPISVGVIVFNAETVYNIYNAITGNSPVTEKWVTVGGDLPDRYVVKVPLGMRVSELFDTLGIEVGEHQVLFDGGPSMGKIKNYRNAIITKTTKGVLVLPDETRCVKNKQVAMDDMLRRAASACCGCVRCTEMCPRRALGYPIEPHKMIRASLNSAVSDHPELIKTASLCCSCGVCAEVCCQDISPKDVILHLKGILAKTKTRFEPDGKEWPVSPERPYRMISSERWEDMIGVRKYDVVPRFIPKKLKAERVEILTSQHIGAPASPVVKVGDKVKAGQLVAECGKGLSVAQHASISGTVVSVDPAKIVIEA